MPDDYDYDNDFENVLTSDAAWWAGFQYRLGELASNAYGQQELWPVDDFVQPKSYVVCPRRGRHLKITECWACWCDWAWGNATASDVLAAGDVEQ
jgi:hypothetical protein